VSDALDTSSQVAVLDPRADGLRPDRAWAQQELRGSLEAVTAATGGAEAFVVVPAQEPFVLASTTPQEQWDDLEAMADAVVKRARCADGPVVVDHATGHADENDKPIEALVPDLYAQAIVCPLWHEGELVGALCILVHEAEEVSEANALDKLGAMGPVLADAVHLAGENVRLRERFGAFRRRVRVGHELAKQLVEHYSMAVLTFDHSLTVTYANARARKTYHLGEGSRILGFLEGMGTASHLEPWASRLREVLDRARTWDVEHTQARDGQAYAVLRVSARPLRADSGRPSSGMLAIEDTSNQLALEKRIEVSERYAAVGKLAARVAHELNNPLDGILRYVNMAGRLCESGGSMDKVVDYLSECRIGLLRMADLVRQLLDFSRSTHTSLEPVDVNRVMDQAVRCMFGRVHEGKVRVVREYGADMPVQTPSSLFQVFCNLIKNSLDAMNDGGVLTLRTKVCDERQIIEVSDDGPGLPAGDPDDLFRPFFTTKGPSSGTGLGLPISRDIVNRFGGTLTGADSPSGGAVFTVDVPLHFE
jgi:signal transduction histidine kinase